MSESHTPFRTGLFVIISLALCGTFSVCETQEKEKTERFQMDADRKDAVTCSEMCGAGRMVSWSRQHGCQCAAIAPSATSTEDSP